MIYIVPDPIRCCESGKFTLHSYGKLKWIECSCGRQGPRSNTYSNAIKKWNKMKEKEAESCHP